MTSADPLELFDRLRTPPEWSAETDLDDDRVAAEILERVFAGHGNVISLDAARRRRRIVTGTVVVAALAAGGAVAAWWSRDPAPTGQVSCWTDPIDPPTAQVTVRWDGIADPLAVCESALASAAPDLAPPTGQLRACIATGDVAVVIPGEPEVCDALGFDAMHPSSGGTPPEVAAAAELDRRFNDRTCVAPDVAAQETTGVLEQFGLGGWDIKIAGSFSADEPCASVGLDTESTTARIVPVARRD